MRSRLARRTQKQSKKQFYSFIGAIIVLIVFLYTLGPLLLTLLGSVSYNLLHKKEQAINYKSLVQPPILDPIPSATPSASITITGRAFYDQGKVDIYVNGSLSEEVSLSGKQEFEIKNISLNKGDNFIKAKFINTEGKESDFTDESKVIYIKDQPKVDVSSPSDNAKFTKGDQEIDISGTTTPSENTVTVNGFVAIVQSDGSFTYRYKLNDGDNKIDIVAIDVVGNKTTKTITVNYSN